MATPDYSQACMTTHTCLANWMDEIEVISINMVCLGLLGPASRAKELLADSELVSGAGEAVLLWGEAWQVGVVGTLLVGETALTGEVALLGDV